MRAMFRSLLPRSNGMRVPREVARHIRRGNDARDHGNWQDAITAYADALSKAPHLAHIWVQLGHARKESGAIEAARADYARAASLAPGDPDPRIHLGLSSKLLGQLDIAHEHYLAALERRPDDLSITIDALRTAPSEGAERDRSLSRIAAVLGIERSAATNARTTAEHHGLCMDITDLLAYFGRARLPTGIQRVQIEIIMAIGSSAPDLASICCYSSQRRGWSAVEAERFLALAGKALASDDRADPEWRGEVAALHVALARAPLLRFETGDILLNLGTSWSERNYLLHVRSTREESGLAYVPLIYDCIPMFAPRWFPTALVRDYRAWMTSLLDTADGVIAISQATRSDLLRIAPKASAGIAPDAVRVVPMDGDFRREGQTPSKVGRLAYWGLKPRSYVLMVSTLEPRKNHVGAFEAWLDLIGRHGARRVPTLVCVGGQGWLNEPVHSMLRRHPELRNMVMVLSGIADADLDLLYRCALFTLYPSFYEGWGLPVTESLCHSRVPAISNSSSLPEAGGSFAIYFDPHDPSAIAEAITPLILNDEFRHGCEQRISADFRPRPWQEIAIAMMREASELASRRSRSNLARLAELDIFYTLGSDTPEREHSQPGECFRAGWNWAEPNVEGNPIGPSPSTLRMRLPTGPWTAHLRLSGESGIAYRVTSSAIGNHRIDRAHNTFWLAVPIAVDVAGLAEISIDAEGELLLAGFVVTKAGKPAPLISDSAPA